MLKIHALPAKHGDCIWIEYGDNIEQKNILIDGGTGEGESFIALEKRIKAIKGEKIFELLVITHIDADHIGGVLRLLQDYKKLGITFKDIWFNGYSHLLDDFDDLLGPVQGEMLSKLLVRGALPWNKSFNGNAVAIDEAQELSPIKIGDFMLTLLSPTKSDLKRLIPKWELEVKKAGLIPGFELRDLQIDDFDDWLGDTQIDVELLSKSRFRSDSSVANKSSIAFLIEYNNKRCLFSGDAHVGTLNAAIKKLGYSSKNRLRLDLLKVSHHGSKSNINKTFLKRIDCKNFLFSTNGDRFKHPDKEAIARIIANSKRKPRLLFNYCTEYNEIWKKSTLRNSNRYPYDVSYARSNKSGISKKL